MHGDNLHGADLSSTFLSLTNFTEANLSNVNFNGADFLTNLLKGADVSGIFGELSGGGNIGVIRFFAGDPHLYQ